MIHTVTIRKFIKVSVQYSVHITHNAYVGLCSRVSKQFIYLFIKTYLYRVSTIQ